MRPVNAHVPEAHRLQAVLNAKEQRKMLIKQLCRRIEINRHQIHVFAQRRLVVSVNGGCRCINQLPHVVYPACIEKIDEPVNIRSNRTSQVVAKHRGS